MAPPATTVNCGWEFATGIYRAGIIVGSGATIVWCSHAPSGGGPGDIASSLGMQLATLWSSWEVADLWSQTLQVNLPQLSREVLLLSLNFWGKGSTA